MWQSHFRSSFKKDADAFWYCSPSPSVKPARGFNRTLEATSEIPPPTRRTTDLPISPKLIDSELPIPQPVCAIIMIVQSCHWPIPPGSLVKPLVAGQNSGMSYASLAAQNVT